MFFFLLLLVVNILSKLLQKKNKSATLEFPHNPENSLGKESRQMQPFFAPSLPDVTVRTDASLSMDKVPDAGDQDVSSLYGPLLHRGGVFSLQFVKLNI